jgi:hypothetical protein
MAAPVMVRRTSLRPFVLFGAFVAFARPCAGQPPTLNRVLERAGQYVSAYATQFSSVVAEERSMQREERSFYLPGSSRVILSDFLVIRVPASETWIGFRDVFEVDGVRVRDREDRLLRLFVEAPSSAVEQARRLADESARFNVGPIVRNFNLPTTALFFLLPSSQWRLRFKHVGTVTRAGTVYWVVRGDEVLVPTFIRAPGDHDVKARVEYVVDPDSGRVMHSELRLSDPVKVSIGVEYRADEKLGLWAPTEMRELYEQGAARITCTATYSKFRRFQVNTDTTFR